MGGIEFHEDSNGTLKSPILLFEDSDIISRVRDLWGEPKVIFSYPQPKSDKSEPKLKQPETSENRDSVIKLLKNTFPEAIETIKVPGGEAVLVNGSKLILYDYGISSRPSEFIPWARTEEVKQCVTKFISLNQ